jgi:hypothetical protein
LMWKGSYLVQQDQAVWMEWRKPKRPESMRVL